MSSVTAPNLFDSSIHMISCGMQQQAFDVNGAVHPTMDYMQTSMTSPASNTPFAFCCKSLNTKLINEAATSTTVAVSIPMVTSQRVSATETFTCSLPQSILSNNMPTTLADTTTSTPSIYSITDAMPASLAMRLADSEANSLEELLVDVPQPCFVYRCKSDTIVKRADTSTTQTSSIQWTKPQPAIVGPYTPNYVVG